jgi:hypothetical protein
MNSNIKKFEYPDFGKAKPLRLIDLDTTTWQGKILMMAVSTLSTKPGFSDKTPDEILTQLDEWAREIYGEDE